MTNQANEKPNKSSRTSFIERLADRFGLNASAKAVFAEPIERDGITIIPVAKTRWGFGGGSGRKKDKEGIGAGGGVQVAPLGYIEIKDGQTEYKPIRDPASFAPIVIIGGFTGWILLRALRKLIRG